jgi:hypothetical protein
MFHTAAKTAAKGYVISMRPKRFECAGPPLREFRFCSVKLRDERQPFGIGQPLVRHNELPLLQAWYRQCTTTNTLILIAAAAMTGFLNT